MSKEQSEEAPRLRDNENFNERRSLRRLQERRDFLSQARNQVVMAEWEGPDTKRRAIGFYHSALKSAIGEFKPYLLSDDLTTEVDYWDDPENELQIGEVREEPPAVLVEGAEKSGFTSPIEVLDPPTPSEFYFQGLRDVYNSPTVLDFQFEVQFWRPTKRKAVESKLPPNGHVRGRGGESKTMDVVVERELPVRVLDNAEAALSRFCIELGIDAGFEDNDPLEV